MQCFFGEKFILKYHQFDQDGLDFVLRQTVFRKSRNTKNIGGSDSYQGGLFLPVWKMFSKIVGNKSDLLVGAVVRHLIILFAGFRWLWPWAHAPLGLLVVNQGRTRLLHPKCKSLPLRRARLWWLFNCAVKLRCFLMT